ncbi:hypothetical protein OCH239_04925 [Roseivivax halodurans JCM 10272]|uniref:Uncharacterized protein n=1 Tax=Roseivivax halodurans JCM 10272 TaxID=1449350 RepID=X7EE29_9RHOB|nr:hypothetical protein [Roseivivax halodurans]ETX14197.1 hypothetical protein OCH239_04925 [Roseivivax halodurans JCM 10272]
MQDDTEGEVLAVVRASAARRVVGVGAVAALGVLLVALALSQPLGFAWRLGLLAMAAVALWGARQMQIATRAVLELTRAELRERGGETLARIDEVARVDRSAFAMKPSNGFVLTLDRRRERAWRPGLWWRLGRRVAVGGVTSGSQTRPMADIIAALTAER